MPGCRFAPAPRPGIVLDVNDRVVEVRRAGAGLIASVAGSPIRRPGHAEAASGRCAGLAAALERGWMPAAVPPARRCDWPGARAGPVRTAPGPGPFPARPGRGGKGWASRLRSEVSAQIARKERER